MKILMKAYYLKTIFDACKNYIADKNYTQRPILQTVQLTCADGFCTAYALDGVKMITLTVPYVDGDAGAARSASATIVFYPLCYLDVGYYCS